MKKLGIKLKDVRTIQVPNYDNLSINRMIEWAAQQEEGKNMKYFPDDEKEFKKMSRSYIATTIYSVLGGPFKSWIKNQMDERNEKRKAK